MVAFRNKCSIETHRREQGSSFDHCVEEISRKRGVLVKFIRDGIECVIATKKLLIYCMQCDTPYVSREQIICVWRPKRRCCAKGALRELCRNSIYFSSQLFYPAARLGLKSKVRGRRA